MDRGRQALRSSMVVHVDDELAEAPPTTAEQPEQEITEQEDRKNEVYASLAENPGWKLIKAEFEDTIAAYRSGRTIMEAISKGISNEKVGELTRTSNAVADELQKIILTVETAVEQVEEKKNGRRPKRRGV